MQYVQKKEEKDAFSFTKPDEVRWPGPRANACTHVGSHKKKSR